VSFSSPGTSIALCLSIITIRPLHIRIRKGKSVSIILYNQLTNASGKKLNRIVKSIIPRGQITTYQTIDEFSQGLRQSMNGYRIAVILAESRDELLKISELIDWSWNLRVILILPDHERETISIGCKLNPRFTSYIDSDFNVVGAVLEKMFSNLNGNDY